MRPILHDALKPSLQHAKVYIQHIAANVNIVKTRVSGAPCGRFRHIAPDALQRESRGKPADVAEARTHECATPSKGIPEGLMDEESLHIAPVLEFDHVSFSYDGGADVLEDVTFSIAPGQIVALAGSNGSGKSTVAKLAEAFLLPSSGSVSVLGQSTQQAAEAEGADGVLALRSKIGLVMQNPDDQMVASIVVDEVAFGPSNLGLPKEEVIDRVQNALDSVRMSEFLGCNVNTLSGGQRQRIAIADALAMDPALLILDEPTSMLDEAGRRDVRAMACALRDKGMAVLWITHFPEDASIADRVLKMEGGKALEIPPSEAFCDFFDHASTAQASITARKPDHPQASPERVIEFRDVSFAYSGENELAVDIFAQEKNPHPVFEHVGLDVFKGETLAIVGPNGCGKSTLLQLMNGLLKPTSGEVLVFGTPTSTKEGANAARRKVGLCLQYPERSLFCQTVRDEVAFGPKNIGMSGRQLDDRVRQTMNVMRLPFEEYADRTPFNLSGGEQRKVALAGVLALDPEVLVLDEPCSSLDGPAHSRLIETLASMKAAGQTMVIVTHDMRDVEALADRVYHMNKQ